MNEAIKLAIEKGGYRPDGYSSFDNYAPSQKTQAIVKMKFKERIVLDPKFWQALGKALGWKNYVIPEWHQYAHQYFDLILTGGDREKFWEELTNGNNTPEQQSNE